MYLCIIVQCGALYIGRKYEQQYTCSRNEQVVGHLSSCDCNVFVKDMEEIWKDIKGYEGLYQVSNLGRVRGLDRFVDLKSGKKRFVKGRVLKPYLTGGNGCQYYVVDLTNSKTHFVHRLVAETFIPNPNRLNEVNHKDENKLNNKITNLEWCTHAYNVRYSIEKIRQNHHRTKVLMINKVSNEVVKTYQMMKDVEKDGMKKQCVSRAIRGVIKTYRGYIWKKCD